ncbi:MAG: WbqC family protein [Chitinophagaceae bacterium]
MLVIDNHYFFNINYFKFLKNNEIILSPKNLYSKGWYNNKCEIVGANGKMNLSIPLIGGRNQRIAISELKIMYESNWQKQHLKAIASCYGNAPYFDYYYPILQSFYSKRFNNLFESNLAVLEIVCGILNLNVKVLLSETIIQPKDIIFTKQNISLNKHFNESNYKYPQVFEDRLGFIPNLSIIDLLMCMGPASKNLLV